MTVSCLLTLLEESERQGVDPRTTSLRVGVFGAEPYRRGATPEQREAAAAVIARGVKDGVGLTIEAAVVDPGTLERSVGTIRRVQDLREP